MPSHGHTIAHMQISALRVFPTVRRHLSTVSISHFTFRIPHSAVPHYTNSRKSMSTKQGWVFAMAKTIFAGTVEKTGKNRGKN